MHRGAAAGQHLRRQIQGGADKVHGAGVFKVAPLTGAEVHQHQPAARLPHYVLRLDVAMDQSCRVHCRHRSAQLLTGDGRFNRPERSVGREQLLERAAAQELHPEPDAVLMDSRSVDQDDIRVSDPREGLRFTHHTGRRQLARGRWLQQLQCHFPVQPWVARAVDFAEAPFADLLDQD